MYMQFHQFYNIIPARLVCVPTTVNGYIMYMYMYLVDYFYSVLFSCPAACLACGNFVACYPEECK